MGDITSRSARANTAVGHQPQQGAVRLSLWLRAKAIKIRGNFEGVFERWLVAIIFYTKSVALPFLFGKQYCMFEEQT